MSSHVQTASLPDPTALNLEKVTYTSLLMKHIFAKGTFEKSDVEDWMHSDLKILLGAKQNFLPGFPAIS